MWASLKEKRGLLAISSFVIVAALVAVVAGPVVASLPLFSPSSEDERGRSHEGEIEIEDGDENIVIANEDENIVIENEDGNVNINIFEFEIDLTAVLVALDDTNEWLGTLYAKLIEIVEKLDDIEQKLDYPDLQVAVDLTYCASGGIHCEGSGHTAAGAASTNHNLIRIAVLVTLHGEPVVGLADDDLVFVNSFVPAGGGAAVEFNPPACGTNCYQSFGGLYVFFVDRGPTGNWTPGHYFATLTVTTPSGATQTALIDWEIA